MHHRFNGHEVGQTPGDGEGQGSLAGCGPWGHEESDMMVTEQQQQHTSLLQRKGEFLGIMSSGVMTETWVDLGLFRRSQQRGKRSQDLGVSHILQNHHYYCILDTTIIFWIKQGHK